MLKDVFNFLSLFLYNVHSCINLYVLFKVIELPVKHPELFEALGIDQPKVCHCKVSTR